MHTVLPSPLCPVWGTISQERSRSPWFRLPAPSTWQKGSTSKAAWSPKRRVVPKRTPKWLPRLGLNPSPNLPPQPHFRLLPQLATEASIPGRCGPVVWSQLSPSSSGPHHKSLFGDPSWLHPVIIHCPPLCLLLFLLQILSHFSITFL